MQLTQLVYNAWMHIPALVKRPLLTTLLQPQLWT